MAPSPSSFDDVKVVYATWDEEKTASFPKVLEYRQKWMDMGFRIDITPSKQVRDDINQLQEMTASSSKSYLQTFDSLESPVMKYDMWRYAKIYLNGGVYADVDVEPLQDVQKWLRTSMEEGKAVFLEESSYSNTTFNRIFIPMLSDYQQIPSYANCFFLAPTPRHPVLLELLDAIDPLKWKDAPNPRRTLMTTGPGLVTATLCDGRTRDNALLLDSRARATTFVHHGFGTWKSWRPKEQELAVLLSAVVGFLLLLLLGFVIWRRKSGSFLLWRKARTLDEGAARVKGRSEVLPLLAKNRPSMRKRNVKR